MVQVYLATFQNYAVCIITRPRLSVEHIYMVISICQADIQVYYTSNTRPAQV